MSLRNGWRNMTEAPKTGERITLYEPGRGAFEGWWKENFASNEAFWMDDQDSEPDPIAWQPLLSGPYETLPSPPQLLRPEDLKVEVLRRRPPGGQHVGVETGIKVTHLPSGLIAECDTEHSQHRNRSIALDMILGGLTSTHFRG